MPDVDELLRADGAAWRGEIDAQRQPVQGGLVGPSGLARRNMWRAPLAAALLTVVVAAAISYFATRGGTGKQSLPALPVLPTTGARVDRLNAASRAEIEVAQQRAKPVPRTNAGPGGDNRSMPWQFLALLDHGRTILLTYAIGSPC